MPKISNESFSKNIQIPVKKTTFFFTDSDIFLLSQPYLVKFSSPFKEPNWVEQNQCKFTWNILSTVS